MARLVALLLLLAPAADAVAGDAPRPHIVIFLADDLGWKDVGFHGSEIKTPHLDGLAASGVVLDQFYVQPVCSPTRSSLMTGRYPIRQGLQTGVIKPWADYGLPLEERTLAQALKEAGYSTAITGKWHLGLLGPGYLPTRRGFDHQYGHYLGAIDYWTHKRDGGLDWHRDDEPLREEGYSTNLIAKEAVRIIRQHDPQRPLFLYVPFNAAHTPLQVPEEYLRRYATIANAKRRRFAAMVTCMDDAIGSILAALSERKMRGNTLVFFSSDNGGARAGADNGPLRGRKGTLYEGGLRVPALMAWPGRLKPGRKVVSPLHIVDLYPTLVKLAGGALKQKLPLDGVDAWPALERGETTRQEILHNLEEKRAALRVGDWKLVVTGADRVELFDIAKDPCEKTDLSSKHPDKVKELRARLTEFAKQAVPARNAGRRRKPRGFVTPEVWGH